MPFSHGSKARLLVQGYDWSQYLRSVSSNEEKEMVDMTVLTSTGKGYWPGLRDGRVSIEGFDDFTTVGPPVAIDKQIENALAATATCWTYLPVGDTFGARMFGYNCWIANYEITSPADNMVTFTAEGASQVGRQAGLIAATMASRATGNGTTIDNGVGPPPASYPTTGLAAFLHVSTMAATTLDVVIEDSSDGSTGWATIATFTQVAAASAPTGQALNLPTQAVKRYVRERHTCAGGNATFWVGVARYFQL